MFETITFAAPWLLGALLILPALWYLLRLTPPSPKNTPFGPFVLLHNLTDAIRKPKAPPWWFWLIRLGLAALIIIALAGPSQKQENHLHIANELKLVILLEDSGAAAAHWPAIQARLQGLAEQRRHADQPIVLLQGSKPDDAITPLSTAQFTKKIGAITPVGYPLERDYSARVYDACGEACNLVIITDSMQFEGGALDWIIKISAQENIANLALIAPEQAPPIIRAVTPNDQGLAVNIHRGAASQDITFTLRLLATSGQTLKAQNVTLNAGTNHQTVQVNLANALRPRASLIRLEAFQVGERHSQNQNNVTFGRSAASSHILPLNANFWQVALLSSRIDNDSERLTSAEHYLRQALQPMASVRDTSPVLNIEKIDRLMREGISTLFIFNAPAFTPSVLDRLKTYVEAGGQIIWIASPTLGDIPESLSPVQLRSTPLRRGGTFEWAKVTQFGESRKDGPLSDLTFDSQIGVFGQILPEPGQSTETHTWLFADDDTPLITGRPLGLGHLVYFHAGLTPEWSDLVLHENFLPLLKRLLNLSAFSGQNQSGQQTSERLNPIGILDGFGTISAPSADTRALTPGHPLRASAETPPGLYGQGFQRKALAYSDGHGLPVTFAPNMPDGLNVQILHETPSDDIKALIFVMAFILLIIDGLILTVQALSNRGLAKSTAPSCLLLIFIVSITGGNAEASEPNTQKTERLTHIGFVETGETSVDRRTRIGLETLLMAADVRSTFQGGRPIIVDFANPPTTLAELPIVFWPLRGRETPVTDQMLTNIALYLKQGGMLVFDTRDFLPATQTLTTPAKRWLVDLHKRLALPPLKRAPDYHVIARSFYLLSNMTGRLGKGRYWVSENIETTRSGDIILPKNDGLTSIVVVESDMAGLWAAAAKPLSRTKGLHLSAVPSDWEMAIRGGINLILYALTGNYKADQVHVPKLLSIIGQ